MKVHTIFSNPANKQMHGQTDRRETKVANVIKPHMPVRATQQEISDVI